MFGMSKKSDLKKALETVQRHHLLENPDALLRDDQLQFIDKLSTFKAINESYRSESLSAFGGLAKFALNALNQTFIGIQNNNAPAPIVIDLVEKMAHTCLTLNSGKLDENFMPADKVVFGQAAEVANKWLGSEERSVLLADLARVMQMSVDAAKQGDAEKKAAMEAMIIRKAVAS
jgi:hypothetical protein